MIDIHCHILPLVDDGSSSVEMSLDMLDQAYRHGTREIVLTPHLAYAYHFENPYDKIKDLYDDFKMIVRDAGIPIKMHLGCEFLYSSRKTFDEHFNDITTLADTSYLLMEFFFDASADDILNAVKSVLERSCIPVVAHPERFEAIQTDLDVAFEIKRMGGYLQMNKGSVLGNYGALARETVLKLLNEGLIDFVGSDAHNLRTRYPAMDESYNTVRHYFGDECARVIFEENPKRLLSGGKV